MTSLDVYKRIGLLEAKARDILVCCTELRALLASMQLPDAKPAFTCDRCLGVGFPTRQRLEDHMELIHDVSLLAEESAA